MTSSTRVGTRLSAGTAAVSPRAIATEKSSEDLPENGTVPNNISNRLTQKLN